MKKNVLLIAPTFFGYYKEIIKELENNNYDVDFFKDIPTDNNLYKAITRVSKSCGIPFVNNYYKKYIEPIVKTKQYDFVFIIFGLTFSFTSQILNNIKKYQSKAKFIAYQWDGEENLNFVTKLHTYFDDIYTFDRIDALNNNKYKFLPLFYIDKYKTIVKKNNYKYEISYIGTAHPKKIKNILEMSTKLSIIYKNQFIYNYMPSKLKYIYHKLTSKEYKKISKNDLNFKKIPYEKTMDIFENSMCILDAPQKGQNGLTIRTIECLGAKRKLITSNEDIKNYDFYLPENIYIYNGNFDFNDAFFKSDYRDLDKSIYEKYSLKIWIKTIFNS